MAVVLMKGEHSRPHPYFASWKMMPSVCRMPLRTRLTPWRKFTRYEPAGALYRPVMHREGHRIALGERHHFGAALHARALLGQHELAAGEIAAWLGQQDRHLDRKGEVAIKVLVQAIEVAGHILQQQRRRPRLPGHVALREERRMLGRIALGHAHAPVPRIGDIGQARIERGPQAGDELGQRISEIAVLALAEAVARHVDMAAEMALLRIERRDLPALPGRQQLFHHRAAMAVQLISELRPGKAGDAGLGGDVRGGAGCDDVHQRGSGLGREIDARAGVR